MNEVERLECVKKKLLIDERQEFAQCIEVLNDSFRNMINNVSKSIIEDEVCSTTHDENLVKALVQIKALADKHEVDFPKITNENEAKLYTVKYGKEVLFS